jgi:hypothetical protein
MRRSTEGRPVLSESWRGLQRSRMHQRLLSAPSDTERSYLVPIHCSERCSNWKQLEHRQTPLGMAREYMHRLRHENHDDDRHLSDHRIDTIRRTHPCDCNECVSARNSGQPDHDQLSSLVEPVGLRCENHPVLVWLSAVARGYALVAFTRVCTSNGVYTMVGQMSLSPWFS